PWTLDKIADTAQRQRYREAPSQLDKSETAKVVLDCASCHRLEGGDNGMLTSARRIGPAAAMPAKGAGAYMLPVNYELHCSACHPLTFDTKVVNAEKKPLAVPHHLEPAQLADFLWGAYARSYVGDRKQLPARVKERLLNGPSKPARRPLPGKAPVLADDLAGEEILAHLAIDSDVSNSTDFLFKSKVSRAESYLPAGKTSCGECHYFTTDGTNKQIVPVGVKAVWLEHGKFNHVAHRAFDCRGCHANAYALEADGASLNRRASESATDVLIAGLESCRQCHSPAGGVNSDCAECHTYHNGDKWLQGLGAAARDPLERLGDVQQFLSGANSEHGP
ncbi:MAG: hypothetical protein ACRD36_04280, partial [Candidatus Acidiferrum sp.]